MEKSPESAVLPKRDDEKIHTRPPRGSAAGGIVSIGFDIKDPNRFDASATK